MRNNTVKIRLHFSIDTYLGIYARDLHIYQSACVMGRVNIGLIECIASIGMAQDATDSQRVHPQSSALRSLRRHQWDYPLKFRLL